VTRPLRRAGRTSPGPARSSRVVRRGRSPGPAAVSRTVRAPATPGRAADLRDAPSGAGERDRGASGISSHARRATLGGERVRWPDPRSPRRSTTSPRS
jgi:hypothetical protein